MTLQKYLKLPLLALAVDAQGDGVGGLFLLAHDQNVMDAGSLGALDAVHALGVAPSHSQEGLQG